MARTTLTNAPSISVTELQTVACRSWDCRMFASVLLWRDPQFALGESSARWVDLSSSDMDAVRSHFGDLPQWPGEFIDLRESV